MSAPAHCGARWTWFDAETGGCGCGAVLKLRDGAWKEWRELRGVAVRWVPADAGSYREAEARTLVITRAWRARWPAQMLIAWVGTVFSAVATAVVVHGVVVDLSHLRGAAAVMAVVGPLLVAGLGYTALALSLNRTQVTLRRGSIDVMQGPIPWGPRRHTVRRDDVVRVVSVEENDVRNLSGSWPAPEMFQVIADDGLLFEQIPRGERADRLAEMVRAALALTC